MKETRKELSDYEAARIQYRNCDYKNAIDTAYREGLKEGLEEALREKYEKLAQEMKAMGYSSVEISERIDILTNRFVEKLYNKHKHEV